MLKSLFILTLLFTSSLLFANEQIGFKSGNKLKSRPIYGTIHLYCPQNSSIHTCRMNYLEPGDRDKFIHPPIDADKVTLEAIHQQGSRRKKSAKFDAVQGESKKRFNLWLGSLFQRPLLRSGKNIMHYKLYKNSSLVKSGSFIANVQTLSTRRCRTRTYHSTRDSDCDFPSFMCQKYFSEQAYCQ